MSSGLDWNNNMAAVSLFWDTNVAAVKSCENTLFNFTCGNKIVATYRRSRVNVKVKVKRKSWAQRTAFYTRKFYARKHVKITKQSKSTLITEFLSRAQKGMEAKRIIFLAIQRYEWSKSFYGNIYQPNPLINLIPICVPSVYVACNHYICTLGATFLARFPVSVKSVYSDGFAARGFGLRPHPKFPPHARKTSVTQGITTVV